MLLDLPLPVLAEVLHGCLSHLEGQCALCALRCSSHVGCALGSGEYLLSAVVRRWPLAYASAMAEIADGTVDAFDVGLIDSRKPFHFDGIEGRGNSVSDTLKYTSYYRVITVPKTPKKKTI